MNKKRKKSNKKGWRNEPIRHGLASQGIRTSTKMKANGEEDDGLVPDKEIIDVLKEINNNRDLEEEFQMYRQPKLFEMYRTGFDKGVDKALHVIKKGIERKWPSSEIWNELEELERNHRKRDENYVRKIGVRDGITVIMEDFDGLSKKSNYYDF